MLRRDFREKNQPAVMIIPMIDIMLFLLVFFMLSTIYMVQTNTLQVSLPQSGAAQKETRPNVVPITVLATGEIFYEQETAPTQDLALKIKNSLADDPNAIFVLRGDKSARYENIVAVLDLLKKSGAKKVSIATELKN